MKIFDGMQSFFNTIVEYVKNFSTLFYIFLGAFLVLSVIVVIVTSFAYECQLTKTVDRINKFLERNPRINDDNLVAFNNLMKAPSVPKALRRQWQQFMLYREHPASYYMSFKHCVENPLRNSTYRQQMTVYKVLSYVLAVLGLVASAFMTIHSINTNQVLQDLFIIPCSVLVLYWIISMVLDMAHNAISSDLFQNFQHFEINMDKALLTLPEFVDYEVLFSQDEIRRGIPVLYAYLQKRAIQEQQELEKARLTNTEHEKFDFNEAGLDGSLVLDRAMRETENYSAQRKKYMQEIERVNNEISALENNYRELVKEFQRQVQTGKETVESLKEQLEQASSTIEINYIKKQMRDELARQQSSEKDFDIITEKHNTEIKGLNQEIKRYEDEIKKAKENLEAAMFSEFNTYSVKVYDNLEKIVDDKMQDKIDDYKDQIKGLEGQLEEKNEELENVYTRYQEVLSQVPVETEQYVEEYEDSSSKKNKKKKKNKQEADNNFVDEYQSYEQTNDLQSEDEQYNYAEPEYPAEDYNQDGDQYYNQEGEYVSDIPNGEYNEGQYGEEYLNEYQPNEYAESEYQPEYAEEYQPEYTGEYQPEYTDDQYYNNGDTTNYNQANATEYQPIDNNDEYVPLNEYQQEYVPLSEDVNNAPEDQFEYVPLADEQEEQADYQGYVPLQDEEQEYVPQTEEEPSTEARESGLDEQYVPESEESNFNQEDLNSTSTQEDEQSDTLDFDFGSDEFDFDFDDKDDIDIEEKPEISPKPQLKEMEEDVEDFDINKVLGLYEAIDAEKSPAKTETKVEPQDEDEDEDEEMELETPKRKAGRPRKIVDADDIKPKRKVGRPRKMVDVEDVAPKRRVGRPRKVVEDDDVLSAPVRKPGRPRKVVDNDRVASKRRVGRPRKSDLQNKQTRSVGRPRKNDGLDIARVEAQKRGVGRPRKSEAKSSSTRNVGRPRKDASISTKKRGRPRKS